MGHDQQHHSLRYSPASITSSTRCTPSAPSCIGMLARVWKKENSPKLVKTLRHSRRITRKLALKLPRVKEKRKATATSSEQKTLSEMLVARTLSTERGLHRQLSH